MPRAPRKRRRPSPLPEAVPPARRAGPGQPCRRALFEPGQPGRRALFEPGQPGRRALFEPGQPGRRARFEPGQPGQPCRRALLGPGPGAAAAPSGPAAGLRKKFSGRSLPKIKENVGLTEESSSYNYSSQVNVRETTDLETKEEESEESSVPMKESSIINFESKESLKSAEMTSGTGMTLPTGVSTFLIDCLDVDSTADFNNTSDSLKGYSSPETFRYDNSERSNFYSVDLGKYKNSTLLDSSKAVTIDKIPQMSNLSAILEPVPKDFQDQYIRRKSPSNFSYSSSALSFSTTLAGKKLCKITAARERTPDLKSGMRCPSPLGPESKPANQTAKPKRLKRKKKETSCNLLEESSSSFRQLDAPGNTSAQSEGLTGVVPIKAADAVVQMTSTMLINEENKALKNPGNAQLAPLDPLGDRKEICSIVRLSPKKGPSRLQQVPVNRKEFRFPKGVPEDPITSTKNWTCCKQR